MPSSTLRSARSAKSNPVFLNSEPEVKIESFSPITGNSYVSLRRVTRSVASSTLEITESPDDTSKLNLSRFAFAGSPPRKKIKVETSTTAAEASPLTLESNSNSEDGPSLKPNLGKKTQYLAARVKPHAEPPNWQRQYALIERMRAGIKAPVDTMGCERPLTMEGLDAKTLRFHILISLMLSSQTKDAVTSQAVLNLHSSIPGGLTAETLAAAPTEIIQESINKVGFWRRKTEYIQDAARKLLERSGADKGDIPKTIEELCELKGVGPKMGFLCLQAAWDINAGIGVDVHVHRITNRLKWHKPPSSTPEQTRINLESWLPPHLHKPINPLLVGFGQVICLPIGPRCDICLLGQNKLCPSRVQVNAASRKEIAYTFTADDNGDSKALQHLTIGYEMNDAQRVKSELDLAIEDETLVEVKTEVKVEPA